MRSLQGTKEVLDRISRLFQCAVQATRYRSSDRYEGIVVPMSLSYANTINVLQTKPRAHLPIRNSVSVNCELVEGILLSRRTLRRSENSNVARTIAG